ncbi:hypothetical protein ALI144C_29765 [Actinosynnema sp. ALI-1.44]|nr:hypothetical protein ALI144C_29765 [Actinosynnema sp. ALI-1.44]
MGSSDPVVAAGQYRYVVTRAWNVRGIGSPSSGPMSYLAETVIEVWAPQDYRQEWMQERATTGRKKWLQGDERQAREANLLVDYPSDQAGKSAVLRAQCGDFGAVDTGKQPCTTPGSWQAPTPEFVAGLPRDPQQLHERLLRDAPGERRGDARALVYAADALRSGLLPADVRSALYQALTRLRGLEVTDGAANLDGRTGTALGIDDGERRQDIIVDPATGTFIGERQVLTGDDSDTDLPEGTVTSFTSVQTTVVQTLGERPPR